jgi:hypothetical protein
VLTHHLFKCALSPQCQNTTPGSLSSSCYTVLFYLLFSEPNPNDQLLVRFRDCVIVRSGHSLLSSNCPPARRVLSCRLSPCGVTSPEQATAPQSQSSYYIYRTSQPPPTLWCCIETQLRVVTGDSGEPVSIGSVGAMVISDDLSISAGKSLMRLPPSPQNQNLLQALHRTRIVATAN